MLKHVVQLTGLTALAVALSVGSVAQAAPVASVLTGDEMAFAFAAPVAADGVQVLSQGEMQTTEGAIAPIVIYGLVVAGRIAYVGITNNLARRTAAHTATKMFDDVIVIGSSSTRNGARIIEQTNINRYNTINNGMNRINSISPRNPLSQHVTYPYR